MEATKRDGLLNILGLRRLRKSQGARINRRERQSLFTRGFQAGRDEKNIARRSCAPDRFQGSNRLASSFIDRTRGNLCRLVSSNILRQHYEKVEKET